MKRGGFIAVRKLGDKNWILYLTQADVAKVLNVSRPMVSLALHKKFKKTGNVLMGYEIIYVRKGELLK